MTIKPEKVKLVLGIIISLVVLIGIEVINYFATSEEVESVQQTQKLIQECQDMSIHDDRIERRRRDVQMIRQHVAFERKEKLISEGDKEIIRMYEDELEKLKEERADREKYWKATK